MKEFVCFAVLATLAIVAAKPQGYHNSPPSSGPWNTSPQIATDPGYYPSQSQTATQTITKHVYVHVAPPEPEVHRPAQVFPTSVGQKHYKIIFVKAPTYNPPPPPVIPAQAQNEEKTLVYVLVKKPEEAAEISIPTPAPTQPSKPEVYFIRYKTDKQQISQPQPSYGPPAPQPQQQYGAPAPKPQQSYGAPSAPPSSSYGSPSF